MRVHTKKRCSITYFKSLKNHSKEEDNNSEEKENQECRIEDETEETKEDDRESNKEVEEGLVEICKRKIEKVETPWKQKKKSDSASVFEEPKTQTRFFNAESNHEGKSR